MKQFYSLLLFVFVYQLVQAQQTEPRLLITKINSNVYVYTTFNTFKGARFPANGLYVVTGDGVLMIDTPWDTTQFQVLVDSIELKHHQKVVMCLSTHFHEDRTGGLTYYQSRGIKGYSTVQTDAISAARGFPRAGHLLRKDTVISLGGIRMQTYYPGAGHTTDNIVCWFPQLKLLYGGCLIKSLSDNTLGNTADGNLQQYANSVRKVLRKFSGAKQVIPGHQQWGGIDLVRHTLMMAENQKIR